VDAPQMPSVADHWPDQPAPVADPPPSPADEGDGITWIRPAETRTGRVRLTLSGVIALALLVAIGVVLATLVKQAHTRPPDSSAAAPVPTASPTSAAPPIALLPAPSAAATSVSPPPRVVPPPAAPELPATASFEMAATSGSVTVRSQDLGADLYRVTLGRSTGPVEAKVTGNRLTLVKDPATPAPPIAVSLNSAVRWNLKLTAGNTETAVDLAGSRLASLELAGGAHVFTLALPPASGTLPVRVTHGMNQLKITTNGVPVRITLHTGAGEVVLDGTTHTDTKPGAVITSDAWPAATGRVDLDAVEGIGTLTVDTD
jgi:hypothetical protein